MKKAHKKNVGGRPKGAKFTEIVNLKLTPEQHAEFQMAAAQMGIGLTTWIRYAALEFLASKNPK